MVCSKDKSWLLNSTETRKRLFFWCLKEKEEEEVQSSTKRNGDATRPTKKEEEKGIRIETFVPIPVALLLIPPRRILGHFQVVALFVLIQIVALLSFIFSCNEKKSREESRVGQTDNDENETIFLCLSCLLSTLRHYACRCMSLSLHSTHTARSLPITPSRLMTSSSSSLAS